MSSHPSERPTWTSAGNLRTVLLGLASGGVCQAAASPRRRCALTAPFQPCRPAASRVGRGLGRCVFCGTVPRVSPGRRYRPPCPLMSGLSSKGKPPRTARSAPRTVSATKVCSTTKELVRSHGQTEPMYDVIYIDAHGSETPVAQHLDDRGDAADVARRAAADRGVGRMFLPGSTKLPNCVCVVPVAAPAEAA